jgi:hypothetical protein
MNRIVRTLAALLVSASLMAVVSAPADAAPAKADNHQWCC